MGRARVGEVMTAKVITVNEDTPFAEIVDTLAENKIGAMPVIDGDGTVTGIVTEADLLFKEELSDRLGRPKPLIELPRHRRGRAKATATDARGVMSEPAVTVRPGTTVAEAARRMSQHGFTVLPVVDEEGRPVGILSRGDVLKVFLRSDDDIRNEVIREVVVDAFWQDPSEVHVRVNQGVVSLTGRVEYKSYVNKLIRLAAAVEGVVDVVARLGYHHDDTRPGPYAEA